MKKTFIDEMEKWFNSLSGEQLIKTWNDFTNGIKMMTFLPKKMI
jgi:hypothetical protein